MSDLPIPVHVPIDASEFTAKRAKHDKLPECFVAVVKQNSVFSAVGLVNASSVSWYYDDDSTTWQYVNLIDDGKLLDKSKYVVWQLKDVRPISDGPLIIEDQTVRIANVVGKGLSPRSMDALARKHIMLGSQSVRLGSFIGKAKLRTFKVPEPSWRQIAFCNLTKLVTPSSVLYHAGIDEHAVRAHESNVIPSAAAAVPVPASSSSSNPLPSSAAATSCDLDSDGESAAEEDNTQVDQYPFDLMRHAMKLGMLLKNADNIKEAVKSSLMLAKAITCVFPLPLPLGALASLNDK